MLRDAVGDVSRSTRLSALARERHRELRDVCLPDDRSRRIHRVLVCPSGVHVVVGQPLTGPPSQEVLDGCVSSAAGVSAALPARYRDRVRPVLCCSEDEPIADLVGSVLVTSTTTLEHIIRSSPVVLSTSEVLGITARLGAALEIYPVEPAGGRGRWRALRRLGFAAAAVGAAAAAAAVFGLDVAQLPAPW